MTHFALIDTAGLVVDVTTEPFPVSTELFWQPCSSLVTAYGFTFDGAGFTSLYAAPVTPDTIPVTIFE